MRREEQGGTVVGHKDPTNHWTRKEERQREREALSIPVPHRRKRLRSPCFMYSKSMMRGSPSVQTP